MEQAPSTAPEQNDREGALEDANMAIRLDPGQTSPYISRTFVLYAELEDYAGALASIATRRSGSTRKIPRST